MAQQLQAAGGTQREGTGCADEGRDERAVAEGCLQSGECSIVGLWYTASLQASLWAGGVCVQVTAVWRVLQVL